jgi:hypothetical protein
MINGPRKKLQKQHNLY